MIPFAFIGTALAIVIVIVALAFIGLVGVLRRVSRGISDD